MAKISREQLIKLQAEHKTDAAIGILFGMTRQAVHQLRNKYGIPSLGKKNTERNREIIQQHQNSVKGIDLAKRFGLSVSQTYRILNGHKRKRRSVSAAS